jgi:hypothetical protein
LGGVSIMFRVSNSVYREVSRYFATKQIEIYNEKYMEII